MSTELATILSAVLLWVLASNRRTVAGRGASLFRVLFPSWRFFDDELVEWQLAYRTVSDGHEAGPWRDALPAGRRLRSLLTGDESLRLALHSLVDRLVADLDDLAEDESADGLVSYSLVRNAIEERLRAEHGAGRYQFAITAATEQVLLSLEHELAP